MFVTIKDTVTGIEENSSGDPFYWTDGEGSCDCNRELLFCNSTNSGYCIGAKRYLIVDFNEEDGDRKGGDPYTLAELNSDYPDELLKENGLI